MKKYLYHNRRQIIITVCLIITVISIVFYNVLNNTTTNTVSTIIEKKETSTLEIEETYYIDLKGAVKNPGVYKFETAVTINTAITTAGGFDEDANTDNINLSKRISDGMVIYVYHKEEIKSEESIVKSEEIYIDNSLALGETIISEETQVETKESGLVNINTASAEALMTLSGIGESKANAIIKYREINGNFTNLEDIMNVSGIGSSTYESIKDNITL